MRKILAPLFAAVLAGGSVYSRSQTIDEAHRIAPAYSAAYLRKDVSMMAAMSHRRVIDHFGGFEATLSGWRREIDREERNGFFPIREGINEIRAYRYQGVSLFLVRTTRDIESFPEPVRVPHVYVLVFSQRGKSWSVLDVSCVSTEWVKALVPSFRDDGAVERLLARR